MTFTFRALLSLLLYFILIGLTIYTWILEYTQVVAIFRIILSAITVFITFCLFIDWYENHAKAINEFLDKERTI